MSVLVTENFPFSSQPVWIVVFTAAALFSVVLLVFMCACCKGQPPPRYIERKPSQPVFAIKVEESTQPGAVTPTTAQDDAKLWKTEQPISKVSLLGATVLSEKSKKRVDATELEGSQRYSKCQTTRTFSEFPGRGEYQSQVTLTQTGRTEATEYSGRTGRSSSDLVGREGSSGGSRYSGRFDSGLPTSTTTQNQSYVSRFSEQPVGSTTKPRDDYTGISGMRNTTGGGLGFSGTTSSKSKRSRFSSSYRP